jgi:hypothetical protein
MMKTLVIDNYMHRYTKKNPVQTLYVKRKKKKKFGNRKLFYKIMHFIFNSNQLNKKHIVQTP